MPVMTLRLTEDELKHLKELAEKSGAENNSEFVRLLLAREWNRRRGLEKPQAKDYQTAFRNGRPKEYTHKF